MRIALSSFAVVVACAACTDSPDRERASTRENSLAEALTSGMRFDGGKLKNGRLPKADSGKVKLALDDGPLKLAPAESELMALDVENPDEDDNAVVATLMQFEDAEQYIAVPSKPR